MSPPAREPLTLPKWLYRRVLPIAFILLPAVLVLFNYCGPHAST